MSAIRALLSDLESLWIVIRYACEVRKFINVESGQYNVFAAVAEDVSAAFYIPVQQVWVKHLP